ncbi:MAG: hypothetical protein ACP5N3_01525 [Candidatus Nanoarchaeia archaeon]
MDQNSEYKLFKGGSIAEIMPLMASEGYALVSVSDVMKKRVEAMTGSKEDFDAWWTSMYVGDVTASTNAQSKIILDSMAMRMVTPDTKIYGVGLTIPELEYESISGLVVQSLSSKYFFTENPEAKNDIIKDEVWQFLARDNNLLGEYVDVAYHLAIEKSAFSFMDLGLRESIWIPPEPLKSAIIHPLRMCSPTNPNFLELFNFFTPYQDTFNGQLIGDSSRGYTVVKGDYRMWGKKLEK